MILVELVLAFLKWKWKTRFNMCRIAGLCQIDAKSSEMPTRDLLERMAAQLVHRGPDDNGIHIDRGLGFAHRRLSIIDIETGQQPMLSEDKKIGYVTLN